MKKPFILMNPNQFIFGSDIPDAISIDRNVELFRWGSGDYSVLTEGTFSTILNGSNHILITTSLLKLLLKYVPDQFNSRPVLIRRIATNEQWDNYHEMTICASLGFDEFHTKTPGGLLLFSILNTMIGVSSDLKRCLESENIEQLNVLFSNELPAFG
jgi:hypothetical protein